ncbi:MAG: MBL fold metallo-hydrolase [Cyclobacteriaceae bacterium]|nr:MBL fold metallo-hydrolase [Cyclobacteriaceae bacterium]MCH8514862.1 MBL fold metallo-hydrolase [Cyclobacteriaceae bacterium]
MKVTFLGTGTSQGIPVIGCECEVCQSYDHRDERLRTSILIEVDDKHLVVDTGPDFRQQMLREKTKKVDAVLFTHEHKDHTAGLDDIRPFNFMTHSDMPVFAVDRVIDQLKREYAYIFADHKYPGIPRVITHAIDKSVFYPFPNVRVQPIEVAHHKLPVLGFRIDDFTYITDAKTITDEEFEKIKGTKVLVLNALQQHEHLSHLTLQEALAWVERIQPERAYFTHISHRLGMHHDIQKLLPENVFLAYDGLKIKI